MFYFTSLNQPAPAIFFYYGNLIIQCLLFNKAIKLVLCDIYLSSNIVWWLEYLPKVYKNSFVSLSITRLTPKDQRLNPMYGVLNKVYSKMSISTVRYLGTHPRLVKKIGALIRLTQ